MPSGHTLIITPAQHPDQPGDVDYAIECAEVTNACRMWWVCNQPGCPPTFASGGREAADADAYGEYHRHGRLHRRIDGHWLISTQRCFIAEHEALTDAAGELELPEGRWKVRAVGDTDAEHLELELAEAHPLTGARS